LTIGTNARAVITGAQLVISGAQAVIIGAQAVITGHRPGDLLTQFRREMAGSGACHDVLGDVPPGQGFTGLV
jgi:hypothetical protein